LVPRRTIFGKGLTWTKKGSTKGSPMGTAEEPFKVLDSTLDSYLQLSMTKKCIIVSISNIILDDGILYKRQSVWCVCLCV
jgi:hypothetical protein